MYDETLIHCPFYVVCLELSSTDKTLNIIRLGTILEDITMCLIFECTSLN